MDKSDPMQAGLPSILTASGIVLAVAGSMLLSISGQIGVSDASSLPLRGLALALLISLGAGMLALAAALDSLLGERMNIFGTAQRRAAAARLLLVDKSFQVG